MTSLAELLDKDGFARRHLGADEAAQREMLGVLGAPSLDALVREVVPHDILSRSRSRSAKRTAPEALAEISAHAARNELWRSFIGMGYYGTHTPAVIQRNVREPPTAYTPYQAEISQGRLEALLNFQQMVIDLTGLPVANASLLDEATAAAEAMAMIRRSSKSKATKFFVDAAVHPQVLAVMRTRAKWLGIELVVGDAERDLQPKRSLVVTCNIPIHTAAFAISPRGAEIHASQGLVSVGTDLLALMLLKSPGALGADIAIGSAQRFGVPMGYGGPHAAFMACRDEHKRAMPGRIIGVSVDAAGRPALRMALQTREQHIRRDKATSNICTAQALLANIAGFYAVYTGPRGWSASRGVRTSWRGFWLPAWESPHSRVLRHRRLRPPRRRSGASARKRKAHQPALHRRLARWRELRRAHLARRCGRCGGSSSGKRPEINRLVDNLPESIPPRCAERPRPDSSGLQPLPHRDRDDAVPQAPREPRSLARARDDPARLVHDEAQRRGRAHADLVAALRGDASVRPE